MIEFERDEIEKLPYKYRPMSAWGYFGYSLLFLILSTKLFVYCI